MRMCEVVGCTAKYAARGMCLSHYKRWQRWGDPRIRKVAPAGHGSISENGYKVHRIKGKMKRAHVLIAEKALGRPLPGGAVVHHIDENKLNNRNDNLVICPDRAYHNLLHMRLNALKASGHADWRACYYCRSYDDPDIMREERTRAGNKFFHRACRTIFVKEKSNGLRSNDRAKEHTAQCR